MRGLMVWLAMSALLAAGRAAVGDEAKPSRPNVVFLFADDLGWGDLGCYGHPYSKTPHIDRLAQEGTRFTQFYVTGVTCCPSRTGFMTSKWPAEYPVYPANGGFAGQATVTQLLHDAGYATGHFGKWHIGLDQSPGTYGIEETPENESRAAKRVTRSDPRGRDAPIYDAAIQFIEAHAGQPFYVNVWGHISHHAVDPLPQFVERFRDVAVNEADFAPRMAEKFATCRAQGGDPAECLRKYMGDVSSLDDDVGRLLAKLDELGLAKNTIVVFSSDHGAPAIPPADNARDKDAPADRVALRVNLMGYNGGLRGGKHNMYEGGVRSPFLVRWPGHVPSGRVDETSVISGIDWLPTLCTLAGAPVDAARFDGEDVSAAWLGGVHQRRKPLVWKTSTPKSELAIRDGQWKLHLPNRNRGEVELFDVVADPREEQNLAAAQPEVVAALTAKLNAWDATLPTSYEKTRDRED
jgi:arylsulfatase A-like enzyme